MPGRTSVPSAGFGSSTIFTGTRCTTLVKLPVALSGGSKAKVLPVPGDQLSTWPVSTRSGNASTVTRAGSPIRTLRHLGFLVVRDHPDIGQRHRGDHLRADIDELPGPHLTLADHPVRRRNDPRVVEIVAAPASPAPRPPRTCAASCCSCTSRLASSAFCWSSCARFSSSCAAVRFSLSSACSTSCWVPAIRVCSRSRCRCRLQRVALQVGCGRLDGRLGLADQRALHILLVGEVGECRVGRGKIGLGLRQLRAVVGSGRSRRSDRPCARSDSR